MMAELQRELDSRNSELANEEKRLSELDGKFRMLMANKNPASIIKMHDDELATTKKVKKKDIGDIENSKEDEI